MTFRARASSARGAVALCLAIAAGGCMERGYPLGSNGSVDVHLDTAGALFAADLLDAEGKGMQPRQSPFETGVTLLLVEGSEAANGGFVEVRVEPAEALSLRPDDDEDSDTPTCRSRDGKFRCTATEQGVARFILESEGTWSGDATLVITWADQRKETIVEVLPAGLPPTAGNFELIATGLSDTERVLPTFGALSCTTIETLPDDLGSKWRPGAVRAREAFVRATPPPTAPGVIANAPVVIESLGAEAALSLQPECDDADRVTRLRVQLSPTGESAPFYICFSDLGGQIDLSVTSGLLSVTPEPSFDVSPEPRVLRVSALSETVVEGDVGELFEIAAFNTDLQRIAMDVDLESSDPGVIKLPKASETLAGEETEPTSLVVTPVAPGSAVLHVRPRLFSQPDCESISVTVLPAL